MPDEPKVVIGATPIPPDTKPHSFGSVQGGSKDDAGKEAWRPRAVHPPPPLPVGPLPMRTEPPEGINLMGNPPEPTATGD